MPQSQSISVTQRLRQSPQQYLISTMIESTADELVQLINRETEKNVALESDDPREVSLDDPIAPTSEESPSDAGQKDDPGTVLDEGDELQNQAKEADQPTFDNDDDTPSDRGGVPSSDDNDYDPGASAVTEDTFRDDLKHQIEVLDISREETYLAEYIIDSLEDDGYLRRPLIELVDDLEFSQHHTTTEEDLEAVLVEIVQQELEPSGIGARDLRECMLLQLEAKKATPATRLAYEVVRQAFDDLAANRWDRIEEGFGIQNHSLLVDARRVIRHLNPKPGNMEPATPKSSAHRVQQVRPDFIVRNEDGQLVVWLNDGQVPQVRISNEKEQLLDKYQRKAEAKLQAGKRAEADEAREGARFLREAIQSGNLFIDALQQRRNTLLSVMQTIVQLQRAYFTTGLIETLQPMTLDDVASRCQYDVSTISRVSNSKYIDTEFGIIAVKDLFTNEVAGSNQAAVIEALRKIIEGEDKQHPFTDDALAAELAKVDYKIARRTVMKYREILGFPVARLRKEL